MIALTLLDKFRSQIVIIAHAIELSFQIRAHFLTRPDAVPAIEPGSVSDDEAGASAADELDADL